MEENLSQLNQYEDDAITTSLKKSASRNNSIWNKEDKMKSPTKTSLDQSNTSQLNISEDS